MKSNIIKDLTDVANALDALDMTNLANRVDAVAKSTLQIKTAQYLGVQGYWIRNQRCWSNCYRHKRASKPEMAAQEVWFECQKEYQASINDDASGWEKYAGDNKSLVKTASAEAKAIYHKAAIKFLNEVNAKVTKQAQGRGDGWSMDQRSEDDFRYEDSDPMIHRYDERMSYPVGAREAEEAGSALPLAVFSSLNKRINSDTQSSLDSALELSKVAEILHDKGFTGIAEHLASINLKLVKEAGIWDWLKRRKGRKVHNKATNKLKEIIDNVNGLIQDINQYYANGKLPQQVLAAGKDNIKLAYFDVLAAPPLMNRTKKPLPNTQGVVGAPAGGFDSVQSGPVSGPGAVYNGSVQTQQPNQPDATSQPMPQKATPVNSQQNYKQHFTQRFFNLIKQLQSAQSDISQQVQQLSFDGDNKTSDLLQKGVGVLQQFMQQATIAINNKKIPYSILQNLTQSLNNVLANIPQADVQENTEPEQAASEKPTATPEQAVAPTTPQVAGVTQPKTEQQPTAERQLILNVNDKEGTLEQIEDYLGKTYPNVAMNGSLDQFIAGLKKANGVPV